MMFPVFSRRRIVSGGHVFSVSTESNPRKPIGAPASDGPPPGKQKGNNNQRPDPLGQEHLFFRGSLGRQVGDRRDVNRLEPQDLFHPPGETVCGDLLQVVDLRLDARGAPLVRVVRGSAVGREDKDVTAVHGGEETDFFQSAVDLPVDLFDRKIDKTGRDSDQQIGEGGALLEFFSDGHVVAHVDFLESTDSVSVRSSWVPIGSEVVANLMIPKEIDDNRARFRMETAKYVLPCGNSGSTPVAVAFFLQLKAGQEALLLLPGE